MATSSPPTSGNGSGSSSAPYQPSSAGPSPSRQNRPSICGSDAPERPYPIYLHGDVERGFGRGGKDLGCPTANLPAKILGNASSSQGLSRTGIYFGWARVLPQDPEDPELSEESEQETGAAQEAGEVEEDEDDNEVVLGISPINEGSLDSLGQGGQSTHTGNSGSQLSASLSRSLKPRQGSRSSVRSARSTSTVVDVPNNASLLSSSQCKSPSSIAVGAFAGGANVNRSRPQQDSSMLSPLLGNGSEGELIARPASVLSDKEAQVAREEKTAEAQSSVLKPNDLGNESTKGATTSVHASAPSLHLSSSEAASTKPELSVTTVTPVPIAKLAQAGEKHPRDLSAASSTASLRSGSDDAQGSALSNRSSSSRRKKKLRVNLAEEDSLVFPMVMSVGWNPFYGNTTKTAEVHIMHKFQADFYGLEIRVVVLGYIRPEYNYINKEALIEDIEMDKRVTIASLARPMYQDYSRDPFLLSSFSIS
ncbi:hypothetical protein K437DRAFT_117697 [Tilletiaria anomala UBC 951]|uniref:Riboflavin kinase n=1 Tax=Tilletiaria anomala (strain ATCC 24038 / CBS 436.72 / UBC 951) TaxID=1037660 RepID=A0A066WH48_TILAU|nr:uncharacterized protein K437DRAFT_117697 [Tilletiaria anomala UBC 951]KDN53156.1 hypothetical protein K437DRAFT_117697 [Tilletiaria anomala UBC 951]